MQEFIDYLDGRIASVRAEIAALEAEGRGDDANLEKVRANIYEVCRTVTIALKDRPGAGAAAIEARLAGFRDVWGAALEKARTHGNAAAAAVEEIKLEALADAAARFREALAK